MPFEWFVYKMSRYIRAQATHQPSKQVSDRKDSLHHHCAFLQRQVDRLQLHSNRYSWLRVLVFGIGMAASATMLYVLGALFFWGGIVLTLLLFGSVVYFHNQVERALQEMLALQQIKTTQVARIGLDWDAIPPARQTFPRYTHPFEADLDIVGPRSLHRLLDTTVSTGGSQRLRDWLTAAPPTLDTLVQRQTIVAELIPRVHFRNKLHLYGHLLLSGS
jgi:hypothetical protein